MRAFIKENKNNIWFWLFVTVAAVLLVAMPLMSLSAGNSGDEDKFQIPQGQFVVDYFSSGGQDTTCLQDVVHLNGKDQSWNLKYYGCSFDVVTEWINRTFGIEDISRTRHVCNTLLGWLIVLFGGLIAYRIGGWRAGVMALLLLFFSPRLLGHSFNNPKDIPLAAGVTMAIYYMLMFFRQATPLKESNGSKKGVKAVHYAAESGMSDKTRRIVYIVLLALSALLLFPTAGAVLAILILALECVAIFALKESMHFRPATLVMLSVSTALAVSTRIGGLIVVGYMGLWGLLWLIRDGKSVGGQGVAKVIVTSVAVCATGFFGGLLLWPYALQNPVQNSMEAFRLMSQFDVQLRQLFEGTMMMSSELPWYYTPKFIIMTIPLAVIIGWLIYPFVGAFGKERRMESIMIYFTFLFPVIWIAITGANVYGGWRHSTFAYPPMAVAAALGFDAMACLCQKRNAKKAVTAIATALPFILMIPPAAFTIRNHPYEYVYFNELAGGVKKAFGKYELDYYYHSMREATEWVVGNAPEKANGEKTLIGSWHIESTRYFIRHDTARFDTRFVRWAQRYEYNWDYLVFPITGISGQYLLSDQFPPADCVHTVDVDGVPIALVLKRTDNNDYLAMEQLRAGNVDSATILFGKALEINPNNEAALAHMAEISLQSGDIGKAVEYCERLMATDATNPQYSQMAVMAYLRNGQTDKATALLDAAMQRGQDAYAYSMTAQLKAQQGDINGALNTISVMLDKGLMDENALNLYVQIRVQMGTNQRTAMYNFYTQYANGLEKKGNKKNAEQLRKQLNGTL